MTPVLLLLGSNVEPQRHIPQAVQELRTLFGELATSRVFLTPPVGDEAQPPFWNLAAKGCSSESLERLQRALAALEARHGRLRDPARPCGPRTLDLDILLFGSTVGKFGKLQLPSPLLVSQAFVLLPAAEVAPDWVHPVLGKTLRALAASLHHPGFPVVAEALP
jgi:2-amino-4-hydroxy-6-hydroxymethyldihydropteridine diphosphokinase